jgi:hypothetical protein
MSLGGSGTATPSTQLGFVPAAYAEVIAVSAWSDTNGAPDAAGGTYLCIRWGVQGDETWATGTNYGAVVDIAAPGVGIRSTSVRTLLRSLASPLANTAQHIEHLLNVSAL